MTVIIAARGSRGTWLGCDLMVTTGAVAAAVDTKLVLTERWALGLAGAWRYVRLARELRAELDARGTPDEVAELLLEMCRLDGATAQQQPGDAPTWPLSFVLVDRLDGRLWYAGNDLAPIESHATAVAGSGGQFAKGAAWQARELGADPEQVVEAGIGAACAFDPDCGMGLKVEPAWTPERAAAAEAEPGAGTVVAIPAELLGSSPDVVVAFEREKRRQAARLAASNAAPTPPPFPGRKAGCQWPDPR